MNNRKRTALCLLGAALCVFMTFGAALALGRYPITPAALLAGDAMAVRTFTVLRLPRAVMALVGGFGLGVAGFVYQTVFRNPLASPDQRHDGAGQPQHGEGAHCHGIADQQRRRCYGVAAQRKGRTKGHKNAERCAQKAQRRALAVIHRRQG